MKLIGNKTKFLFSSFLLFLLYDVICNRARYWNPSCIEVKLHKKGICSFFCSFFFCEWYAFEPSIETSVVLRVQSQINHLWFPYDTILSTLLNQFATPLPALMLWFNTSIIPGTVQKKRHQNLTKDGLNECRDTGLQQLCRGLICFNQDLMRGKRHKTCRSCRHDLERYGHLNCCG